ncbi:MAG TPA: GNAT family N-acetyltransferase [Burkholderiales bacterium]|nr:GNAT family N-acetyltransferase [Burkholderiales bacterium]
MQVDHFQATLLSRPADAGIRDQPATAPAARRPAGAMTVMVAECVADLATHLDAWQELADDAMESNPFYEPWLLRPAMETLGRKTRFLFAFVYETVPGGYGGFNRLCGFFPMEIVPGIQAVPMRVLRLWKHIHCFLCAPLVRTGRSRETLSALLEWAATDAKADAVDFSYVSGDGPFQQLLVEYANQSGSLSCQTGSFTRALWRRRAQDVETYLEAILSGGVRKEYRRQYRRLQELGTLEFRGADANADLDQWLGTFLRLECSGWKAREGTAIALDDDQRRFVEEAARGGWSRGQVKPYGLFLDDRPLAMLLCFQSAAGLFAFKIAYDEAFAKFSPGVQMTLDLLAGMHKDASIGWLDSCAMPDHPMINRLLSDRRIVQSLLLSTGTWRGDLLVSGYPMARWTRRVMRSARRRLFRSRQPADETLGIASGAA